MKTSYNFKIKAPNEFSLERVLEENKGFKFLLLTVKPGRDVALLVSAQLLAETLPWLPKPLKDKFARLTEEEISPAWGLSKALEIGRDGIDIQPWRGAPGYRVQILPKTILPELIPLLDEIEKKLPEITANVTAKVW